VVVCKAGFGDEGVFVTSPPLKRTVSSNQDHSTRGGSEARLTERGGRRWLQNRWWWRCSGRLEQRGGRGGRGGARGMRGKEKGGEERWSGGDGQHPF
jgi:hypothetical protein